ncbi:MAG: hypothetical protein ABIH66_10405 [bacterium]
MPEVIGYPLDRAGETLRREGISIRNVSVIKPPETERKKYRPKKFEKKTRFVVFQHDVDSGTVDLEVVECGEPGTMKKE